MANRQQLRLLLWKDYLMRKRKLVTLLGIIWATAVMSSLYLVRINVDNEDYPTCGFPARALPSAGVLPFLQSFICGLDNVCSPLDQFDEVPTYENSTLTKLQHKLAPIMNETVLEVAGSMPNAIKLLATLADVVDEPTFVDISKNGLKVKDLFSNPSRVRRSLSSQLKLNNETTQTLLNAQINFQGLLKGNINRCSTRTINNTLTINNSEQLRIITEKLCSMSEEDIRQILLDLIFEINYSKYMTMLGNMYQKLTGDKRLTTLGDLLAAVIRMMRLQHFLPLELVSIFQGQTLDFSYVPLSLVPKLVTLFEPTYGNTDSYQTIKEVADTVVVGLQYLNKISATQRSNDDEVTSVVVSGKKNTTLQTVSNVVHSAFNIIEDAMAMDASFDVFSILSQIMNFITKLLSPNTKHDVLFYSTLLAKLLESAQQVIAINANLEHLVYNVTSRNPEAIKVLQSLPPAVVGKAFEALSDVERTQILTSKINTPGQMFCNVNKIQNFFLVSKSQAEALKTQMCTNAWKNYIIDLVKSFGVYDVKNNINIMASLLIQETLGKDTNDQLYSIDQDINILKTLSQTLIKIESEVKTEANWTNLFDKAEHSELFKTVTAKRHLGKQMLIVIHGSLAKEIVKQNTILDFKISPYLNDVLILVSAINRQLNLTPTVVTDNLKMYYPEIVKIMLKTALNEKKTYKSLSTSGRDIMCNGVEIAEEYLELVEGQDFVVEAMCNATIAIEDGLKKDSEVSTAIHTIKNSAHPIVSVNWNNLINNIKDLYVKLDSDYAYLFNYKSYGMTNETKRQIEELFKDAKEYWFGVTNIERSLRLSIKLILRFMDLLDHGLFDITGEAWMKIKHAIFAAVGPFSVIDDSIRLITGLIMNDTYQYTGDLPITTVEGLGTIIPAIPYLIVDAIDIVIKDNTDVQPVIALLNSDPPWPCSEGSLIDVLQLSNKSAAAVAWVETLLCMDKEVQDEWIHYLNYRNINLDNKTKLHINQLHPFLKLSSMFDSIIDDIILTNKAMEVMLTDSIDGRLGMKEAWEYAVTALNTSDRDSILKKMFSKIDIVINAINTSSIIGNSSVNSFWEQFLNCSKTGIDEDCRMVGRKAWKHFFESISVILENVAGDLLTYITEINEPDSNILQLLGFTRRTGLYMLYDKMPEFVGVLLNSYWDYGFMSQVRRASMSQFWDCEAVVTALVIPPGSFINSDIIQKVQPFICPSLLHWLSIPVGDNILLDVIAKPQYFFYTIPVQNLSSRYERAYTKVIELANYTTDLYKSNKTLLTEDEIKIHSVQNKFKNVVNKLLAFKIDENDPQYRLFNEINTKQFAAYIYLTKIVTIVNKLNENINNLEANQINTTENIKTIEVDLSTIKYFYKRKPADAIFINFDAITDVIIRNDSNYTLVDALNNMCEDLKTNTSRRILVIDEKIISQLCTKKYQDIFGIVQTDVVEDYDGARMSLLNLLHVLQYDENNGTDVVEFLNTKKQLLTSLRSSIKFSYDLSIPIYLKYLQSNMQGYDIILSFLAGQDWWKELKGLYNGPYATKFFGYVEKSFEVAEELLTNFDRIHLVRLLHDIDVNNTESFCLPNVSLSDYLPDSTGMLSELKRQACEAEKSELYRELPPLLFASQGYDNSLKLSRDVNYTSINLDISRIESRLELINNDPKTPMTPIWVTNEKVERLRSVALKLLSKETMTKISFAVLSNVVDATTLFLNNSQCTLCSQLTTWFKQLNLQLFKKQEYDILLCHLHTLTLEDVYATLKNDFHWDMTVKELISTRNYTKYEMNKSINEFLGQVKAHLLEDMAANTTRLTDCLSKNITKNELGNVTLFTSVLSHTAKLFRAALPHLHEVDGIKDIPYLKDLSTQIAQNIPVLRPLGEFLNDKSDLHHDLHHFVDRHDIVFYIQDSSVDLKKVITSKSVDQYLHLSQSSWSYICIEYNCDGIALIIERNLNKTLVQKTLPKLQDEEFWRFTFISNIIEHIERVLSHTSRIFGVASKMDITGLAEARLDALLDTGLMFLNEDVLNSVLYSLQGLVEELHPLLERTPLEHDLQALSSGLAVVRQLRNHLLDEVNLKLPVQEMFPDADAVESGISSLGINNTNFWSLAAPRIHSGYLILKPLLSSKLEDCHVSNFVCNIDSMSKIIEPSNLDVVTAEDVYAAVVEQFCGLPDERAKKVVPVLLGNFNFSIVLDKVANFLLTKLFIASNITEQEGATVLSQFTQMAALVPVIQANVGDVGQMFVNEPVFERLGHYNSLGDLLSSSELMSSVGHMVCGRQFSLDASRFYKNIAAMPDMSTAPDKAQLDVLPTDFCRSLYLEIINVEGGKIVWSFIKPLLMGKILYTPPTPPVTKIIEKANTTFATMIKLTSLVHSFATAIPSITKLSSHREGIAVLQRVMTEPQFSNIRDMITGGGEVGNFEELNVDAVFEELGDMKGISELLAKASQLLQCINLNRFQASPDEEKLTHQAAELSIVNEFTAGVVFLNADSQYDSLSNVEYKIRMDIDNAPTTRRLKDYLWIPGPEASFIENMRYFRGFVQIQDMVDKAIIQLSRPRVKREVRDLDWAVYTQQTPYPCYRKDYFQTSLYDSQSLMIAFFFSLLFTVASAVRFIVQDKETGNTMLMSVMGVNLRWHTLSWFMTSLVEVTVTCACVTLVLYYGNVLPTTDPSLVFVLLLIFGISVLSFCYLMSKLFTSASLAAVCAAIFYLMTFMPYIIILSLEAVLYSSLKIFICLSMSSSLCYAFLYITRYEASGAGATWAQLWTTPDEDKDMSIGMAAAMMIVDAVIYAAIGWLIDRYYGIKTLTSNITHCITTDEKAGVSILNVTKIYNERSRRSRVALDNVSMELQKGQITTLLGHNGAGKTTLINILMGMLRPTRGHVIVRSERAGTRLGMCPQRDVLLPHMTAQEHVTLYAQLKSGLKADEVKDEVERMLQVLSLGKYSLLPVSQLSGGTRRRVCVALAFVGQPHLVSLDEPTSGVDPAARRDIWSMIVKLKEDRTILLTTHHLDEAELLSDQIVIMHKGQIHTTGSPVEIKRTLGNGYKLTVTYPKSVDQEPWENNQDEKTKHLLSVVRESVGNAEVVDVSGFDVEMELPFFSTTGLHNNFLQLCRALEATQLALGFKSYSLDCSSLEQVFHNICQQADTPPNGIEYVSEGPPSKSASSASVRLEHAGRSLLAAHGPSAGGAAGQLCALVRARWLHHIRNRWLLFLLFGLPTIFVILAMGFSMLRPPADEEIPLKLDEQLYSNTTEFIVPYPSMYSNMDPGLAEQVLQYIMMDKHITNFTSEDLFQCKCTQKRQECDLPSNVTLPEMLVLPDMETLNQWLVNTQEVYIEKRYGGYSSSLKNNITNLISWYNNKGHHALPAYLNTLNSAILRTISNTPTANITTFTHPLKISKEQISKATVYQHIADAGISALLLVAYCLVSGGGAIYLVAARVSQEKRLQLLSGVSPVMYWTVALIWHMIVIGINMCISAVLMSAFGFPVFVDRNNLLAICLLIILYGYACGNMTHVLEKLFNEASMANMMLFCGYAFVGLSFIAILFIFDIISESDTTDHARYVLHKFFMLAPPFTLGDGLLEIAKNTIQAQILIRFGMDTYKDPFNSSLVVYHYVYLIVIGTVLMLLNLAIEYDCFEIILKRFRSSKVPSLPPGETESPDVIEERKRVDLSRLDHVPLRVNTLGNINRGFTHVEGKKGSLNRVINPISDVAQCVDLSRVYGTQPALRALTLGIPPGQCTALLGQNGAGKSTTFKMLTGEVRPTAGQIYLNSQLVNSTQLCKGLISYCPQSDAIDPLLTVRETLQFYCQLRGIEDENEVIKHTIEMFDLCKYRDVRASALSGGNKRKLCTAIAFMARTPLVLLDEPTSGMDAVSRGCVWRGVRAACARRRGVLLCTHALGDARRAAARVALLRAGRLVALAPLDDCLTRFGGGYIVQCRARSPRVAWSQVRDRAAHAILRALHANTLQFLIPTRAIIDQKEVITRLSDIFLLMAELQGSCDIEDYTINQSSLEEMFLSFIDKAEVDGEATEVETLPMPELYHRQNEQDVVTAL